MPAKRILAFCLPGVGDALLFTPCLPWLRSRFPHAAITVLTMFPAAAAVFEHNPSVDEILCCEFLRYPGQAWRFLRALRRRQFDISLTPFPSYRREYHLVSAVIGAKARLAFRFPRGVLAQLACLNTRTVPVDYQRHIVENNMNLLRLLPGMEQVEPGPLQFFLTDEERLAATAWLAQQGCRDGDCRIGLHPGSGSFRENAERRRWSVQRFAALAQWLADQPGTTVVVFEGPSESGLAQAVVGHRSRNILVAQQLSFRLVGAILQQCQAFVSNDSGLMHLAAAVQCPTVAIFGSTTERLLHPWQAPHTVVASDIECRPCFTTFMQSEVHCRFGDFQCLDRIGVRQVVEALTPYRAAHAAPPVHA